MPPEYTLCFPKKTDWPAVKSLLSMQPEYNCVNAAVKDIVKNGRSVKRRFPAPTHVLVAFASASERERGHAGGLLTFTVDPYDDDPATCPLTITSLYVHPLCRRQGIGTRLVNRVCSIGIKRHTETLNLMSEVSAIPFWEAAGFHVNHGIPEVCGTVNMWKPLRVALQAGPKATEADSSSSSLASSPASSMTDPRAKHIRDVQELLAWEQAIEDGSIAPTKANLSEFRAQGKALGQRLYDFGGRGFLHEMIDTIAPREQRRSLDSCFDGVGRGTDIWRA
jgi:GNAT superfamily N-acetyltransferase